jgi:dihydroxyacetone kinase DhaKLM complex PTS-EIIA-like component DhaM
MSLSLCTSCHCTKDVRMGDAQLTVCAGDEAVVVGVDHRGVEHAVHKEQAGNLVQLILDLGSAGDLNHCMQGMQQVPLEKAYVRET